VNRPHYCDIEQGFLLELFALLVLLVSSVFFLVFMTMTMNDDVDAVCGSRVGRRRSCSSVRLLPTFRMK